MFTTHASARTAFGGANYGEENPFDTDDYIEPRVDINDAPILCPFNTDLQCDQGCQVCDDPKNPGQYVARCCGYTDTCEYTSQCEIPCTASSQFQGEGVGCMFCNEPSQDGKPGRRGLVACTAESPPCTFDNKCTANTKKKYERPEDRPEYQRGDERDIIHWGPDGPYSPQPLPVVPPENEALGAVANYYMSQHAQRRMTFAQQQQFMQRLVRDQQLAMQEARQQARFNAKQYFWYT